MRFVSWNVNGLRACVQKDFLDFFHSTNADFFCLQETKLQEGQITLDLPGYEQYWCYAEKKGYSGTAIFTKHTPQSVQYGIGVPELDNEGRVITLEYPEFYLVTCYTPNAQRGLARIEHRLQWEEAFRNYLTALDSKKSVILCGDLNVAHKEIDLKNPASNRGNAGFSDEERNAFTTLLESGFTDTFRHLNPTATGCYTWWSYMFNARQNNAGWRIDYFLVSDRLKDAIYRTPIYSDVLGSDHCPVELDLDIRCNGGIWSSSEDPSAVKAETHTDKQSKSSGVKAAALLSATLVLLVGFLVFRGTGLPQPPSINESTAGTTLTPTTLPPGTDYFSYITVQTELIPTLMIDSPISSQLYVGGFAEGETIWKTDKLSSMALEENPPCGINFWVRVIPASAADSNDYRIMTQFTDTNPEASSYPVTILSTRYYDNTNTFAGWFVFGYVPRDMSIIISLLDENNVRLQSMVVAVSPILTEMDAMQMSTPELLDFAMHWRGFIPPSVSSIISPLTADAYRSHWDTQPALKVLAYRKDFHSELEKHIGGKPFGTLQSVLLDALDNQQQGIYSQYGTYPTWEEATAMTTPQLVDYLIGHRGFSFYMTEHLLSSTYPSSSGNSYQRAKLFNPILEILENRSDAMDELLKHLEQKYIVRTLLDQPVYWNNATPEQAQKYLDIQYSGKLQDISTEDLLDFVRKIDTAYSSVVSSTPYTYAELSALFQPMKELEGRTDTIDILLSHLTEILYGGNYTRKEFATHLLKQSVYYDRMTEAQKQTYEANKEDIKDGTESPTVAPSAPQPRFQDGLYSGTALQVILG